MQTSSEFGDTLQIYKWASLDRLCADHEKVILEKSLEVIHLHAADWKEVLMWVDAVYWLTSKNGNVMNWLSL